MAHWKQALGKIYVKKLWVITGMKYSVHLLDILTAATISPSAPCKLSSLGRAHHSTILAISVLKSTTISRFGSKNNFHSSEKMINYVKITMVWCNRVFYLINLNINIKISKSIRMNTNINRKVGLSQYNLETYFVLKTSEMLIALRFNVLL